MLDLLRRAPVLNAITEPWADVMKEGSRYIDEHNNFNVEVTVSFPGE
jgi:hypothetical protein